jgi:hypothetical protein
VTSFESCTSHVKCQSMEHLNCEAEACVEPPLDPTRIEIWGLKRDLEIDANLSGTRRRMKECFDRMFPHSDLAWHSFQHEISIEEPISSASIGHVCPMHTLIRAPLEFKRLRASEFAFGNLSVDQIGPVWGRFFYASGRRSFILSNAKEHLKEVWWATLCMRLLPKWPSHGDVIHQVTCKWPSESHLHNSLSHRRQMRWIASLSSRKAPGSTTIAMWCRQSVSL